MSRIVGVYDGHLGKQEESTKETRHRVRIESSRHDRNQGEKQIAEWYHRSKGQKAHTQSTHATLRQRRETIKKKKEEEEEEAKRDNPTRRASAVDQKSHNN